MGSLVEYGNLIVEAIDSFKGYEVSRVYEKEKEYEVGSVMKVKKVLCIDIDILVSSKHQQNSAIKSKEVL
jgi:hypothetical protein